MKKTINYSADGAPRGRLFDIWIGMQKRCHDPRHPRFCYYGARGITVCNAWRESFPVFRAWALSHGYDAALSIDRIDGRDGYHPDNCRWATQSQQCRNRGSNQMHNGRCLIEWTESLGLPYHTIQKRISRGMSFEAAISTPVRHYQKGAKRWDK